ncbi:hypothetical protein FOMG_15421 [Fusarium oxysporum f. sp. melonis 26406]|nr:hypothetical protein FOZG_14136 [Fusarium oxysporum Fo47]EWZ86006.1 hypothetical protein FOWG_11073 [Fusarium oxysporum f. sp. lycopersici MN25]EXK28443.1 hypothetical protein FOMG_15421 [Fusarium oxysporum f. sp. melonis 26406]
MDSPLTYFSMVDHFPLKTFKQTTTTMAETKKTKNDTKKTAKNKANPTGGKKRKASEMTADPAPAAPVANNPPAFADGPSAAAPSSSPAAPWGGLPRPKRYPIREHYDTKLAHLKAVAAFKRARLDFNIADINWIKREQERLAACLEKVTGLCDGDADSINNLDEQIATLEAQGEEASATSSQDWIERRRIKMAEEKAAAAATETEGSEPTTSN